MREIGRPALFVLESYNETVGEALIEALRAVVGSPFQAYNFRNLTLKGNKCLLHILDLCGRSAILELKRNDVLKGTMRVRFLGSSKYIHGEK